MQFARFVLPALAVAVWVSGCSVQTSDSSPAMTHLIIAEPEQPEFRYEIELAKLNQVLSEDLEPEQMGFIYYRRGALYDAMGLRTLARMDFSRAVDYRPRLADAYNFLGIHYTQLEEFDYAYEALDSAIELEPEHAYAYLNRAIAEYYDRRIAYSIVDFKHHLAMQPADPYRIIWLFIAEQRSDAEIARANLLANSATVEQSDWALQIIELFAGQRSETEFLKQMTDNLRADEKLTERLCEAYFYLGKYKQMQGQWAQAMNYFKLALTTNVYEFVEHRYASLELQNSREQLTEK
ncbi:lipoprotein NlpI [Idiomarina seosinensis]|uniref:lipoprotein NlpI n=1 Tax=Idiomarina seosinensis TaxID=281739 RepID=UPI0038511711